jgi:hypothetical protein
MMEEYGIDLKSFAENALACANQAQERGEITRRKLFVMAAKKFRQGEKLMESGLRMMECNFRTMDDAEFDAYCRHGEESRAIQDSDKS